MKATAEHIEHEGCLREIVFSIEHEEASAALNKIAKKYAREVQIKGFRPGKAPISVIRQRFQKELEGELVHEHLPELLKQEITEKNIRMFGEPRIEELEFSPEDPMVIRVRYEMLPEVELGEYKEIELVDETQDVTEDDVEKELKDLQEKEANYIPVEEREIQDGDYAMCDVVVKSEDGEDVKENLLIHVGSEQNHSTINERIRTLKRGEETEFEIPAEAEGEQEPKTTAYRIKLKEVKQKKLSALDDEFAKDLGDFQSLDELKQEIHAGLETMRQNEQKRKYRTQLSDALIERHTFDVPQTLVEEETNRVIGNLMQELHTRAGKDEVARLDWEALRTEQRKKAAESIRFSLLLQKIAKTEGIEVSDKDVDEDIERFAKSSNVTPEKVRSKLNNDNGLDGLKADILERKVIDFLVENGKIKGREINNDIDPHRG